MSRKNKIIVSIVGISIISLALIGLTYGYYLTRIQGNTNNKSISISTANLELTYSDNSDVITGANIVPGTTLGTKTFTVTNTGNNNVDSYSVGLVNVINTFTRLDDIKYTVTCSSSVADKTCNGVSESTFPNENSYIIENQINKDEVQTYVIKVEYKEMNVDQSIDMGKTLEAKLDIFDTKSLTIQGTVTNSSENDYVVINSKEQTSEIVDGKYKFIGIEPDTHKITIKNRKTTTTKQTTLNVSKGEPAASESNIIYNDEKNIADADITIIENNVKINVIKISSPPQILKDAIINNAKLGGEGRTIYSATPLTKPAQAVSGIQYYTDKVNISTTETSTTISTTYQRYYWTYGTGYTIDKDSGKFTLTGVATCKYNDGTCNKTLIGKYLVDNSAYRNSSSTNTKKTTTNLSSIYKVTTAPTSSTSSITMKSKKILSTSFTIDEKTLSVAEDDYGTSYYYRGGVVDNYVNFAGMCWKIVRIEGDRSTKLILEDRSAECNSSSYTGNWSDGNDIAFGNGSNSEVDFLNGSLAASLKSFQTTLSTKLTTTKALTDYLKIDDWCYDDNIASTEDTEFQRYGAYKRIYIDKSPSLKCTGTKLNKYNDNTDMYVGTLTADEISFAGALNSVNYSYYLMNNYAKNHYLSWWALSPSHFSSNNGGGFVFQLDAKGLLSWANVSGSLDSGYDYVYRSRPAITLVTGTKISSGDGTIGNPYKILEN